MGRLIDVDKFKADCGMADDCEDCKQNASLCQYDIIYSKMDFCGWLDDAPTVDAVTVVRCKDCKYKSTEDNVWVCPFGLPGGPEFFCGYGVDGKDGDGNG